MNYFYSIFTQNYIISDIKYNIKILIYDIDIKSGTGLMKL